MPPQPQNQPSIKDLVTKTVADAQRLAKAQAALLQTEIVGHRRQGRRAARALGIATAGHRGLRDPLPAADPRVRPRRPRACRSGRACSSSACILIITGTITGLLAKKFIEEAKPPNLAIAEFEKTKAALSGKPADTVPPRSRPWPTPCLRSPGT